MIKVKDYEAFNQRRYSNPWIAVFGANGRPDFSKRVGGYTGAYGAGEAGHLFLNDPEEGKVYVYGQKDGRNPRNTEMKYIVVENGALREINRTEAVEIANK